MDELKIGDVVRLKSGGPRMTVTYIEDDGIVGCVWFDEKKVDKRFGDTFRIEALELATS